MSAWTNSHGNCVSRHKCPHKKIPIFKIFFSCKNTPKCLHSITSSRKYIKQNIHSVTFIHMNKAFYCGQLNMHLKGEMKSRQHIRGKERLYLGVCRRVKGGSCEKAAAKEISFLRGCSKERGRAGAGWFREPQRVAEKDLGRVMWWILKIRRGFLMLRCKIPHWRRSRS